MNACELAERRSNPTSCIVSLPGAACAVSSAVNPVPVNIGSTGPRAARPGSSWAARCSRSLP